MENEFNLPEAIEDIRERDMKIKLKNIPKEFNLSEKIIKGKDIHNGEAEFVNTFMIKEFIKILKGDCCECKTHPIMRNQNKDWKCWFCIRLDKLAGDKLT